MTSHILMNNTLRSVITALVTLVATTAMADDDYPGINAGGAFSMAPVEVMPIISPATRLDMIDYFNSASDKYSANELEGKCRVTALSHDHISVEVSEVSQWNLSVIPFKGDTILMVLNSVDTPTRDTQVRFYKSDWKPVTDKIFEAPHLRDFIASSKLPETTVADIANVIPFVLCDITYDDATRILTVRQNFDSYIPEDEYATVRQYMLPEIKYRYNGKRFVRQ